jgi:hypothetical protein
MADDTAKAKAEDKDPKATGATSPAPVDVPGDVPPKVLPGGTPADAAAEGSQPDQLTPEEERQLGDLLDKREKARNAADTVRLKVEGPHTEMIFGGTSIGTDWTDVPASQVSHIMNAAAGAGVTISRES